MSLENTTSKTTCTRFEGSLERVDLDFAWQGHIGVKDYHGSRRKYSSGQGTVRVQHAWGKRSMKGEVFAALGAH